MFILKGCFKNCFSSINSSNNKTNNFNLMPMAEKEVVAYDIIKEALSNLNSSNQNIIKCIKQKLN